MAWALRFCSGAKQPSLQIKEGAQVGVRVNAKWFSTHLTAVAAITVVLTLPFAPFFRGSSLFYGDIILQFIPWRSFASECFKHGYIPLWNPYAYCGMPFLANGQSALFYPFNWLGILIPSHYLVTFLAFFHTLLCGWFSYAFFSCIGCSAVAAMVGAIAYSLSSFVLGHVQFPSLQYTLSWLPLMMLTSELLSLRLKSVYAILLAIVSAIALLCGHTQVWVLCVLLAIIWGFARAYVHNGSFGILRYATLALTSLIMACALTAAQWLPQLELLKKSLHYKVPFYEATLLSIPPWQLFTLFIPNMFGHPGKGFYWGVGNYWDVSVHVGILTTALAVYGLHSSRSNGMRLILLATIIAGCVLSLGRFIPIYAWLYEHLPLFSTIRAPARFSLWAVFALAILSAIGAQQLIDDLHHHRLHKLKTLRYLAVLCALSFLAFSLAILKSHTFGRLFKALFDTAVNVGALVIPESELHMVREAAAVFFSCSFLSAACFLIAFSLLLTLATAFQRKLASNVVALALPFLIACELLIAGSNINPFVKTIPWTRPTLPQYLVGKINRLSQRIYMDEDDIKRCWFAFISYTSYPHTKKMKQDLLKLIEGLVPNLHIQFKLMNAQGYDPLKPSEYVRWLRQWRDEEGVLKWLAVRYIIRAYPVKWRSSDSLHEALISDLKFEVSELKSSLPRAFISPEFFSLPILEMMRFPTPPREDYKEAHIKPHPNPNIVLCILPRSRYTRVFHYLIDAAWSGWKAFIDGHEANWVYMHPAARMVVVSKNNRSVLWAYLPTPYLLGLYVSMFSVLLLIAYVTSLTIWRWIKSAEQTQIRSYNR